MAANRPERADVSSKKDLNSGIAGTDTSRVTVYDIAEAAGTSVSTVSRVLNGSALIADATRRAVLEAADRLGYTQRRVRRPAGRSVLNIVVFLPRAAEPQAHLFYDAAALFAGIESGLGDVRAHTIAAPNGSTSPFEGKKLGDIDGCIFAFCDPSPAARATLTEREVPTVVINRLDDEFACVVNDYTSGMAALAHAVATKRPGPAAWLTVETANPVARYRWEALLAQESLAIGPGDRFEFASISRMDAQAVEAILEADYQTLLCANDLVAVAVYERLLHLGVRVPREIGLTGYDAAPVLGLVSQPITTVDLAGRWPVGSHGGT
ncbi:MAG: LacI family DNA-binding transcriptional regulator, partial [Spirochaetota bacterium]